MSTIRIAHRGNRRGKMPELENNPAYLAGAIDEGFQVELDVWRSGGKLWLGHDFPEHKVSPSWLLEHQDYLWVHGKNLNAVEYLAASGLNWFSHQNDDVVLTAKGFLWCFPGVYVPGERTVILEFDSVVSPTSFQGLRHYAVCADSFADSAGG